MKKFILLPLVLVLALSASGCKKQYPLEDKISQLRSDVLYGEVDQFELYCYVEKREDPYEENGNPGNVKPLLLFKITPKNDVNLENALITAECVYSENRYSGTFEYKPLTVSRYCKISPIALPSDLKSVKISVDGKSYSLGLKSLKKADSVSHLTAIEAVKKSDENSLAEFFTNDDYGEIYARILSIDGEDYWYLGFISDQSKTEYLLDAKTCEILSVRRPV